VSYDPCAELGADQQHSRRLTSSIHWPRLEVLHNYRAPPEKERMVLNVETAMPGCPAVYTLLLSV